MAIFSVSLLVVSLRDFGQCVAAIPPGCGDLYGMFFFTVA